MKTKKIIIILSTLITLILLNSCGCKHTFDDPEHTISQKRAEAMGRIFEEKVLSEIEEVLLKDKNIKFNNEVWFSLKDIANYANYVFTEGKKKYPNKNIEDFGLRVYLGVKIDDSFELDIKENHGTDGLVDFLVNKQRSLKDNTLKTTLFFVPTINNEIGNVKIPSIDPLNYGTSGEPAAEVRYRVNLN